MTAYYNEIDPKEAHSIAGTCGEVCSTLANTQSPECQSPRSARTRGAGSPDSGNYLNPWANPIWLPCADGKARPAQCGIQPLVNGLPRGVGYSGDISPQIAQNTAEGRVMRLRGYGNAIVPQLAAEFIKVCQASL